eukprot:COSAG05_NODE_17923_length_317_cov_0.697248_2_plen_29_part_01
MPLFFLCFMQCKPDSGLRLSPSATPTLFA